MTSSTVVLTLHGLSPLGGATGPIQPKTVARYTVAASIFRHIANVAAKHSPGTVQDFLYQQSPTRTVLTFDDGLNSDHDIALPILRELGIAATFFVSANNIGQSGYMNTEQIREMTTAGMEIGSHGLEHHYLVTLSRAAAEREISESKDRIEQIIGRTVTSFAAVGGHFRPWMLEYAAASGYQAFASMIPGRSQLSAGGIAVLRRNHIQAHHSLPYITALAKGQTGLLTLNILRYRILELPKIMLGMEGYDRIKARLLKLLPIEGN